MSKPQKKRTGRGHKVMKDQPIKEFDSDSFFFPRIANEFPVEVKEPEIAREKKFIQETSLENMIEFIKSKGFVVYKQNKKA